MMYAYKSAVSTLILYGRGVLTRVVTLLTSIVSSILIVKIFSVEGKGVLSVYNSSIGLIASFTSLSLSSGIIYYSRKLDVPFYGAKNSELLMLMTTIILLPLLLILKEVIGWLPFLSTSHVVLIWLIVGMQVLIKPLEAGFTSIYASGTIVGLEIVRSFIYLGGMIFLLFNTSYASIDNALYLISASFALKFILARFLARNSLLSIDLDGFKRLLKYSLSSFWGNIIQKYNVRVDIIILAFFTTAADIGIYSILVMYAQLQWVLVDGISTFYGPKLVDSISESKRRKSVKDMLLWIVSSCSVIMLLQVMFADMLFTELFDIDIHDYRHHLIILLAASLIFTMVKVLTKYFSSVGQPNVNSFSALVSFLSTGTIGLYLISNGILGACYASLISYLVGLIYLIIRIVILWRK